MAALPIYDKKQNKKKHLNIFFSRTKKALSLNLGVWHLGLKVCEVCSNDDHRLTLTFFTARSNLCPHTFVRGKCLKNHFLKMYRILMAET